MGAPAGPKAISTLKGRVQDSLRGALKDETLAVPEEFAPQHAEIVRVLRRLAGRLEIKNADERRRVRPRQAVLRSPEFKALWDRIKHKTTYRVAFDNEDLLEKCARALREAPAIPRTRLQWRKADIAIGQAGVEATETSGSATVVLDETDIELPDVLTELQDRTQLTRRSIQRILSASRRLDDFKRNPQQFIELAGQAINRCKQQALVDGIKYQRLGDEHYLRAGAVRDRRVDRLSEEHARREQVGPRERGLRVGRRGAFCRPARKKRCGQGVREVARMVPESRRHSATTTPTGPSWSIPIEGERLYFVVETKGSSVSRRSPHPRERQDCLWTSTLQRPAGERVSGSLRGGDRRR